MIQNIHAVAPFFVACTREVDMSISRRGIESCEGALFLPFLPTESSTYYSVTSYETACHRANKLGTYTAWYIWRYTKQNGERDKGCQLLYIPLSHSAIKKVVPLLVLPLLLLD